MLAIIGSLAQGGAVEQLQRFLLYRSTNLWKFNTHFIHMNLEMIYYSQNYFLISVTYCMETRNYVKTLSIYIGVLKKIVQGYAKN